MTDFNYIRFEMIRNLRIWQFAFFSLAWPLILFLTIAESNRHHTFDGVSFPLYFMTGMAAMGAMIAVVSRGALIANDRSIGWTRQMRITPLRARAYFAAKVLCGYLMALATVAALGLAGTAVGVRLSAGGWLSIVGLFLAGLVPFALLGIFLGHVLSPDSVVPAVGGITTLFALVGGAYGFQIATSGLMFGIMKALPSYWLVQAGRTAVGSGGWPAEGWIVIAVWTAVLAPVAALVYQRDTSRV